MQGRVRHGRSASLKGHARRRLGWSSSVQTFPMPPARWRPEPDLMRALMPAIPREGGEGVATPRGFEPRLLP